MKQKGYIFLSIGVVIALIRIFISGHFNATGNKLIPEYLMVISFWLQMLCISLGITLWYFARRQG